MNDNRCVCGEEFEGLGEMYEHVRKCEEFHDIVMESITNSLWRMINPTIRFSNDFYDDSLEPFIKACPTVEDECAKC